LALQIIRKKSFFGKILVATAMFTTNSMGIVLVLPIAMIYTFYVQGTFTKKYFLIIGSLITTALIALVVIAYNNINTSTITGDVSSISRIYNISNSASFLSRMNSMTVAVSMVGKQPFLGWGVQSNEAIDLLKSSSTSVEENIGINSFVLSMLVWFGTILSAIMLLPVVYLIFSRTKFDDSIKVFVLSTVLGAALSISYYNLYNTWTAIGLSLCVFQRMPEQASRLTTGC
jgi:hypothetical protein